MNYSDKKYVSKQLKNILCKVKIHYIYESEGNLQMFLKPATVFKVKGVMLLIL